MLFFKHDPVVVLLVVFSVLYLWSIWAYIKVRLGSKADLKLLIDSNFR